MRITAVIAVNAAGDFAPLMLILKHSVSSEIRPDQSKMKVIRDLHKKPGFTVNDGWTLFSWEKEMTITGVTALHKVVYIKHEDTGHVIKAHIRTNRANRLYKSFQVFKQERDEDNKLPLPRRKNAEFDPPKPTHVEGITDLFRLFDKQFKEQKFKDCINRTFVKTGTIPIPVEDISLPPQFHVYAKDEICGTMLIVSEGTNDPTERGLADVENEEQAVERTVLNYYIHNNDMFDGDETDTDDEM